MSSDKTRESDAMSDDFDIPDIQLRTSIEKSERERLLCRLRMHATKWVQGESGRIYTHPERHELRILKMILQIGHANVYSISKSLRNSMDYSTVLRALRRMEKKGFVKTASGAYEGRRQKVYRTTFLGQLIGLLAQDNWKQTIERIKNNSARFRDCLVVHRPDLYRHYDLSMASRIIENLADASSSSNTLDLDDIATDEERKWIKTEIFRELENPELRLLYGSQCFQRLADLSKIPWINIIIIQLMDEHSRNLEKWLKENVALREELASRARMDLDLEGA